LLIAFIKDRNAWRKRSREELQRMIEEPDWGRIGMALKELKRRGEKIETYAPFVLRLMIDESSSARTAGKLALKAHFPHLRNEIPDYEATAGQAACTAKVAPLLQRYEKRT
jgi:hypothetical protein